MKLEYNYNLVNNWDLFILYFINKKSKYTHTHKKEKPFDNNTFGRNRINNSKKKKKKDL